MEGFHIDPLAVVALADAIEDQKPVVETIGTRLRQAAQPFNGGATDLNDQTRAVIELVNGWFARAGETLEAVAAELDDNVSKYLATEEDAAADQRELAARLQRLAPQGETPPVTTPPPETPPTS